MLIYERSTSCVLCGQIWRDDRRLFKESIRWKKMTAELKRHKKIPIFSTWSALLNTASQQLPVWILAFYFSPTVVGFYALGKTVLSMPMSMIGGAIAQVFFQKASEAHNRTGDLPKVVEEVFKRLVSLGIFPVFLLTLIGKDLFIVAFGTRWAEAGVYMQILGIWLFFVFISSPISTLICVLEKQGAGLLFNITLFLTRAISLIGGGLIGDVRIALIFFSATGAIAWIGMCFWLLSGAGVSLSRSITILTRYAVYCMPILGIITWSKWYLDLAPICILLIGITGVLAYYSIVVKQDRELQKPIILLTKKLGFVK
jgi:lipopolysaccharide exporter